MRYWTIGILILAMIFSASCTKDLGSVCNKGDAWVQKRIVVMESISRIELAIAADLFVQEGQQNIEIEAPADIIDRILSESKIGNGKWKVELDNCYDGPAITIWATLPEFAALDILGDGKIQGLDTLSMISNLGLDIDGSGSIKLQMLDAETLDLQIKGGGHIELLAGQVAVQNCEISGAGQIDSQLSDASSCRVDIKGNGVVNFYGSSDELSIDIEGDGDVDALELNVQNCSIKMQGEGSCKVRVQDELLVNIEGAGEICYEGQPIISTAIFGDGALEECN